MNEMIKKLEDLFKDINKYYSKYSFNLSTNDLDNWLLNNSSVFDFFNQVFNKREFNVDVTVSYITRILKDYDLSISQIEEYGKKLRIEKEKEEERKKFKQKKLIKIFFYGISLIILLTSTFTLWSGYKNISLEFKEFKENNLVVETNNFFNSDSVILIKNSIPDPDYFLLPNQTLESTYFRMTNLFHDVLEGRKNLVPYNFEQIIFEDTLRIKSISNKKEFDRLGFYAVIGPTSNIINNKIFYNVELDSSVEFKSKFNTQNKFEIKSNNVILTNSEYIFSKYMDTTFNVSYVENNLFGYLSSKYSSLNTKDVNGGVLNKLLETKLGKLNKDKFNFVYPQFFMGMKDGIKTNMKKGDFIEIDFWEVPNYLPHIPGRFKKRLKLNYKTKIFIFSRLVLQPYDNQILVNINGEFGYVDGFDLDLTTLGKPDYMLDEDLLDFKYYESKVNEDLKKSFEVFKKNRKW